MGDFNEKLFGCFASPPVCLFLFYCPAFICCVQAVASDRAIKEGKCVPCLCGLCLGCIGMAYNRSRIRNRFLISGSLCSDLCVHCCCTPCAVCQEYREVNKRTEQDKKLIQ